jgi:hypothetical protein
MALRFWSKCLMGRDFLLPSRSLAYSRVLLNRPGLWRHCGDGNQRRSLDSPEFPQELFVLVETPLGAAPLLDDVEVDGLVAGDGDGESETLAIPPVIEGGEPVSAGIRG